MALHNGEDHTEMTPFNTPRPLWDMKRSAPVDPTSALLAEGGTLAMNDRDRTALNSWFNTSFQNQFQPSTWFRTTWFPTFFAPIKDRLNANFTKVFDSLKKHADDVVKLRAENMLLWGEVKKAVEVVNTKTGESLEEVSKLRAENIALKKELTIHIQSTIDDKFVKFSAQNAILRSDMTEQQSRWVNTKNKEFSEESRKLRAEIFEVRNATQKDCALQTETIADMLIDRVKREFAAEIMKRQNEVADLRRGFDVQKIVADAALTTEAGFEQLKKELALEISKSREEARREARRTAAATAKPTPAATSSTKPKDKK
jgi:hypothetical protein